MKFLTLIAIADLIGVTNKQIIGAHTNHVDM